MSELEPPLKARGITRRFSQGDLTVDVLKGIDLRIERGETVAIMGASGSGKSTLMHVLGGLDTPSAGEVWVHGQSLAQLGEAARGVLRNHHLGFVYQFHHLLAEFSALENVALPLMIRGEALAVCRQRAAHILDKVGLGARLRHKPGELSGGERQRAAIARALVSSPSCILADEPTGNLDSANAARICDLLLSLNDELASAIVMVTHDTELAKRMSRVITLRDGIIES